MLLFLSPLCSFMMTSTALYRWVSTLLCMPVRFLHPFSFKKYSAWKERIMMIRSFSTIRTTRRASQFSTTIMLEIPRWALIVSYGSLGEGWELLANVWTVRRETFRLFFQEACAISGGIRFGWPTSRATKLFQLFLICLCRVFMKIEVNCS